jgi:hypothetical protein
LRGSTNVAKTRKWLLFCFVIFAAAVGVAAVIFLAAWDLLLPKRDWLLAVLGVVVLAVPRLKICGYLLYCRIIGTVRP